MIYSISWQLSQSGDDSISQLMIQSVSWLSQHTFCSISSDILYDNQLGYIMDNADSIAEDIR